MDSVKVKLNKDFTKSKIFNYVVHPVTTAERTTLGGSLTSDDAGLHVWDKTIPGAFYWTGSAWTPAGYTSFLQLTDTPNTYVGSSLQVVRVNSGESALEFHVLVKGDVGLPNVDDTSDANKPISTATQTALNLKADKTTTITATGNGITGGGNIGANRTISLDFTYLDAHYAPAVGGGYLPYTGATQNTDTGTYSMTSLYFTPSGNSNYLTTPTGTYGYSGINGTYIRSKTGSSNQFLIVDPAGSGLININNAGNVGIAHNLDVTGTISGSIAASGSAATVFLTHTAGVIQSRTASQVLSDLGIGSGYVPYVGAIADLILGVGHSLAVGDSTTGGARLRVRDGSFSFYDTGSGGNMEMTYTSGLFRMRLDSSGTQGINFSTYGGVFNGYKDRLKIIGDEVQIEGTIPGGFNGVTAFKLMGQRSSATPATLFWVSTAQDQPMVTRTAPQMVSDLGVIANGGTAGGELAGTYPNPTVLNSAVIAKLLTGFTSGAGSITSSDSILSAIQKLDGNIAAIVEVDTLDSVVGRGSTTDKNIVLLDGASYKAWTSGFTQSSELDGATGLIISGTNSTIYGNTYISWTKSSIANTLNFPTTTAPRTINFPDASGTVALVSALTGYVPYSGATATLDLGTQQLIAGATQIGSIPNPAGLTITKAGVFLLAQGAGTAAAYMQVANIAGDLRIGINNSTGNSMMITSGYGCVISTGNTRDLNLGTNGTRSMQIDGSNQNITLYAVPSYTSGGTYLVSNAGIISSRTAAQVLSDIGAAPATGGGYMPLSGGTFTGNVNMGTFYLYLSTPGASAIWGQLGTLNLGDGGNPSSTGKGIMIDPATGSLTQMPGSTGAFTWKNAIIGQSTISATLASGTTSNILYYNTGTGLFTYGAAPSLSGYVPYTGATANLDLGAFNLTATYGAFTASANNTTALSGTGASGANAIGVYGYAQGGKGVFAESNGSGGQALHAQTDSGIGVYSAVTTFNSGWAIIAERLAGLTAGIFDVRNQGTSVFAISATSNTTSSITIGSTALPSYASGGTYFVSNGGIVSSRTAAQVLADIGAASAISYVPYLGAIANLDMGSNTITTTGIIYGGDGVFNNSVNAPVAHEASAGVYFVVSAGGPSGGPFRYRTAAEMLSDIGAGASVTSSMVSQETPSGTINGSNVTFTIAFTPIVASNSLSTLHLYQNGRLLKLTDDYTRSGTTITMVTAPLTSDTLLATYFK